MDDKSSYAFQHRTISEGLQNFIDSMVEEIVLEGKPFNTQKKYLRKFSENEGLDYAKLEADIITFVGIVERLKSGSDKLLENLAAEKGSDCYLSGRQISKLLGTLHSRTRLHRVEGIGYYNYADGNGKIVISEKWKDAWEFTEGLAAVGKSIPGDSLWKYGFIDTTGKTVIPFKWGSAACFSDGLACVANDDGDYGYIDKAGKLVIPCRYGMAGYFSDNRAPVWDNHNQEGGYIDKTGIIVIPRRDDWDYYSDFHDGLAPVRSKGGKWGYIDISGNLIIPFMWEGAGSFSEGYAPVKNKDGKWGYIDTAGKVVIPFAWEEVGCFSEGLAPVMNDNDGLYCGLWGYINKSGDLIIPYQWFEVECFKDGLAWVKPSGHYRLIDKKGEYV